VAVSRHRSPRAAKNPLTGSPPPAATASAAGGASRACAWAADGCRDGSMDGSGATAAPRDCASCTPWRRWLHPVAALVVPRPRREVRLLHPVVPVIHRPGAGNGVQWLHLGRLSRPCLPGTGGPGAGRCGPIRGGIVVLVQVLADQAQIQVPALRAPIGALDPGRHDGGVARRDDALGRQPVQAGADRPLGQPGVADQGGHRRERARAIRPSVVGQADEHELARARQLPAAVGRDRGQVQCPGDRLDAHRPPPWRRVYGQAIGAPGGRPLVSVLVSFTTVLTRSRMYTACLYALVMYVGGR
jgi:hypothetical protein